MLVVLASALGLTGAAGDVYAGSASVLVSPGSDAANVLLVPLLLGTILGCSAPLRFHSEAPILAKTVVNRVPCVDRATQQ